jgi:hypothetical protein
VSGKERRAALGQVSEGGCDAQTGRWRSRSGSGNTQAAAEWQTIGGGRVSDTLPDTPVVLVTRCPGCWPELDPLEYLASACNAHEPSREGVDDALSTAAGGYLSGGTEAGGDDNRAWCALFHRKSHLLRGSA